MLCREHQDYNPNCATCVRVDRVASAYTNAAAYNQNVDRILGKGFPHNARDRAQLAKAAQSLNAYLAELER